MVRWSDRPQSGEHVSDFIQTTRWHLWKGEEHLGNEEDTRFIKWEYLNQLCKLRLKNTFLLPSWEVFLLINKNVKYPPQTWHRASYSSKYCLFWGYLSGLFKKQAHQSIPRMNTITLRGRREERSTVHHCSLPVRSLLAVVTVQKVNWLLDLYEKLENIKARDKYHLPH